MKTEDLYHWFGVSESTFRHNRARFFKELAAYAEFSVVEGGVLILDVYIEEYIKDDRKLFKDLDNYIKKYWHKDGCDTVERIAEIVWEKNSYIRNKLKYKRNCEKYLFRLIDNNYDYEYKLAKENRSRGVVYMTKKEEEIYKEIISDIYSVNNEIMLYRSFMNQEISQDTYERQLDKMFNLEAGRTKYKIFKMKAMEKLGYIPIRVIKMNMNMNMNMNIK